MTTPRDDIAGLSERLRLISGVMGSAIAKNVPVTVWKIDLATMAEAAAAIDALQARVKELEFDIAGFRLIDVLYKNSTEAAEARAAALQARVKELEDECFRLAADTCHAGYGDEHGHHRCREVDQANARALRAEQERDEAYERAVSVALAHISEPGLSDNPAYIRFEPSNMMARKIAAAIRRLAVTEKEGK